MTSSAMETSADISSKNGTRSNRSCVWVGAKQLEIQERLIKPVGGDEVLVKVMSTGICGSDAHNWASDKVSRQLVLGHESAGIIVEVGASVTDRSVGQRVAIEPGFACLKYGIYSNGCTPIDGISDASFVFEETPTYVSTYDIADLILRMERCASTLHAAHA
jgi:threonine dehydrogenase-like Zn-dependent dehydrogenase